MTKSVSRLLNIIRYDKYPTPHDLYTHYDYIILLLSQWLSLSLSLLLSYFIFVSIISIIMIILSSSLLVSSLLWIWGTFLYTIPDSKVHGANTGPTWILSAPGGLHLGPMNFATYDYFWWRLPINELASPVYTHQPYHSLQCESNTPF